MTRPGVVVAMRDRARGEAWRDRLRVLLPDLAVWSAGEEAAADAVRFAVAWKPGRGAFRPWPRLQAILSIGAGIDDLAQDPTIPPSIGLVRMIDPCLTLGMREYVLLHVLRHHRLQMVAEANQRSALWLPFGVPTADRRTVGVMGLGTLGLDAARHLKAVGFKVVGWKRTPAPGLDIETHAGPEGLGPFLAASEILVCLLPLTPETWGILDARAFAQLPRGAHVINAGRGECLVEADLLAALDGGQVRAATLDAFCTEPLPDDHPFWRHPGVTVTPHIASLTPVDTGARHIADAIGDLLAGRTPRGWVDRAAGY